MKRKTTEQFVAEAKKIHGERYDYSKAEYINARSKVCIICPKHGEFWQLPSLHINQKCGCPECNGTKKRTNDEFIFKADKVHNGKYNYSNVVYRNVNEKVCIICPEHGEFWQTPYDHLQGHGCPKCSGRKQLTTEEFIQKSIEAHGMKYDYSRVEYVNNHTKVCIVCPKHGEFWQTAAEHMRGKGCPDCGKQTISQKKSLNFEYYLKAFNKVHNGKYDYSQTKYVDSLTKINIICPIHGEFWQLPYDHSIGHGCPKCARQESKGEMGVFDYLATFYNEEIITRCKDVIPPYELDIYVPSKKIAIEYDGLIWHSEKFGKDKNYHLMKTELCEKQGIRLIHIFENEWINNREIVEAKLKHILGCDDKSQKVFARKCVVNEIDKSISKQFLDKNHIQGFGAATKHFGCFYNNELVGVMSFKKERKDSDKWELTRFASDITKHCVGVGGKLFKYFVKSYNPIEIKSFADRRWSINNNNLYIKLGFKLDKILKPDYHYTNNKLDFFHKFHFRKEALNKKYGLPLTMTENEMTQELGYYKIWNCGLLRYLWTKPQS